MRSSGAASVSPRRRLGQHFLANPRIARRIVNALGLVPEKTVVEIGPGTGALTRALLESNVKQVIAIEYDSRMVSYLLAELASEPRLEIVEADVLCLQLSSFGFTPQEPAFVLGNIPYNLTGPILFWLFEQTDRIQRIVLMVQKEVAQRLIAMPGSKVYGITSVATQLVTTRARILFDVLPGAFVPPPKVTSSVILLDSNGRSLREHKEVMELVHAAFNQRRKKLRNALERYLRSTCETGWEELSKLSLLDKRAEELSPDDYVMLSALLNTYRNNDR